MRGQADRFFGQLERTTRLKDAYHAVMKLPPSPYSRLFREGLNFFTELRPGALKDEGQPPSGGSLSITQLEALKMVLGKEVAAERDLHGEVHRVAGDDRIGGPPARTAGHGARRHGRLHRDRGQGLGQHRRGGARASPRPW